MATWTRKSFDDYRQNVWEQVQSVVAVKAGAEANKTLTASMLSGYINTLNRLMSEFTAVYNEARETLGSWADSRYHDYYDFTTQKIIPPWESQLQQMSAQISTAVVSTGASGSTASYASVNLSQADAASYVSPQEPYQQPVTGIAPTVTPVIDPYTVVEQQGFEFGGRAARTATRFPLSTLALIGALGYLIYRRKR
jgi:hypothetical protein